MEKLNKEQFMAKVKADQAKKQNIKDKGKADAISFVIENNIRINRRMHGERSRRGYRW